MELEYVNIDDFLGDSRIALQFKQIKVTVEQWKIIRRAIKKCKRETNFPDMFDGRALELICANYLA